MLLKEHKYSDVEFALVPNDCVVSVQGETKAALLSVEARL